MEDHKSCESGGTYIGILLRLWVFVRIFVRDFHHRDILSFASGED